MTTFLDTNVLIYLLNDREFNHIWSVSQLELCKKRGPAIISDIVYCELSVGMASREDVDAAVEQFSLERMRCDDQVLFRAAVAFKEYKARSGPKLGVLPDFFIGALAEVSKAPLITANARDFTSYFPKLAIIQPEEDVIG